MPGRVVPRPPHQASLDRVHVCPGTVCRRRGSTEPRRGSDAKVEIWLILKPDVYKKKKIQKLYLYSLHPANVQHLGEPIHIHQVEGTDWILTAEYIVYDLEGTEAAGGKSRQDAQTVRQQSDTMQPRHDRHGQVFFLIVDHCFAKPACATTAPLTWRRNTCKCDFRGFQMQKQKAAETQRACGGLCFQSFPLHNLTQPALIVSALHEVPTVMKIATLPHAKAMADVSDRRRRGLAFTSA